MSPTKFNLASQTARADKTSPVPSRAGTFTPLVGARLLDHEGPRTRDERDGTTENSQRVVRVVPPPKTSNNMHALVRSLQGVRSQVYAQTVNVQRKVPGTHHIAAITHSHVVGTRCAVHVHVRLFLARSFCDEQQIIKYI